MNDYPAAIRGKQDIEVYSQITGKIVEVKITEGQKIQKGQPLFIIDQVPYKAALQTATANLSAAKAATATAQLTYEGKLELFNNKVVSSYELKTAENALLSAKARQEQAMAEEYNAKNALSYTVVSSPVDGVAGNIPYRIGTLISPDMDLPLTTVSDNSEMYVYFSISENKLLSLVRQFGTMEDMLQEMPPVSLKLNDNSVYSQSGRIESVSGVIDPKTGTVLLRAVFPNPSGLLHSGGSGNIIIPQHIDRALVIPQSATYEIQNKIFVYRVIDGKTKSTAVSVIPIPDKKEYIVTSGLSEGDKIVSEGVGFLQDGVQIIVK